jgi:hypothetical protein
MLLKEEEHSIAVAMVLKVLVAVSSVGGVSERSALALRPMSRALLNRIVVIVGTASKD